jgi:hypothetical protein
MKTLRSNIHCGAVVLLLLLAGCIGIEELSGQAPFHTEVNRNVNPSNPPERFCKSRLFECRRAMRTRGLSTGHPDRVTNLTQPVLGFTGGAGREELRKGPAQSQIFPHVITASSQLEPTHVLEGVVDALYGDFRDPAAPKAVLEMEFFLRKESASKADIVAAKRYAKSVAVTGRSP